MTWLQQIGAAVLLVVLTVSLQCAGVAPLISWLRAVASDDLQKLRMSHSAALVMRATIAIIILQGTIILLWACCYRWLCFRSWNSAFYFSATSYSTVGYGDVLLPFKWRLLGPLESMMGVLMCGISVSLLFALITHLVQKDPELRTVLRRRTKTTGELRIEEGGSSVDFTTEAIRHTNARCQLSHNARTGNCDR